jgi:O-antigen/teichoic acid export membrane protein
MIAKYNPIMRLFQIVVMINSMIFVSIWPAYTDAIVKKDWGWIKSGLKSSIYFVLIILFPIIFLLMLIGPAIIRLWIGNNIPSQLLCILIGVWIIITLLNQTMAAFLNGAAIMGKQIKYGILSLFFFVIFGVILADKFGLNGLPLAGIIAQCVGLAVNPFLIYRFFKTNKKTKYYVWNTNSDRK